MFRSIDTLRSWAEEFERSHSVPGAIRVIPQDGEGGSDTGLLAMRLVDSTTEIYLEPPAAPGAEWTVVFEPREPPTQLSAAQVRLLAADMITLADLCVFLQGKSGLSSGGVAEESADDDPDVVRTSSDARDRES